jgi:hypothetical protein
MIGTGRLRTSQRSRAVITWIICSAIQSAVAESMRACHFDSHLMKFEGTPVQQARCLLQPVLKGARLGGKSDHLPDPLESLIGSPIMLSKTQFRQFLRQEHVNEADLGGSLDSGVSSRLLKNRASQYCFSGFGPFSGVFAFGHVGVGAPRAVFAARGDTTTPSGRDRNRNQLA